MPAYRNTSATETVEITVQDKTYSFGPGEAKITDHLLSHAQLQDVPEIQALLGTLVTSPDANTVLARLKDIVTALSGFETLFAEGFPLVAGEAHVGEVGINAVSAIVTGTRADNATPYDQYDVVGFTEGLLETTLARVNGGCGTIVKVRCRTSQKTYTGPMRLWGYRVPAASLSLPADGALMTTMLANFPHGIGYIDLNFASEPGAGSDASYAMSTVPLDFSCAAGSKKIYWLAQHRGTAWTPANLQTFSLECEARGG